MMQGPHFRHLTRSYVVALGLTPFMYWHEKPLKVTINGSTREMRGGDLAVVYNHGLYLQAPDGLSWDRKE